MKIEEYSVVYGISLLRLIDGVSLAMCDGFQPLGGVAINTATHEYFQAVVKYEQPQPFHKGPQ